MPTWEAKPGEARPTTGTMGLHHDALSPLPPALESVERAQTFLLRLLPRSARGMGPLVQVALATGAAALAFLVQAAVLSRTLVAPFGFFYVAVALVAWLAGLRAGLLTVTLSAAAANAPLLSGHGVFSLPPAELHATALFLVGATPVALLCGLFRKALLETHRRTVQLAEQAALLERAAETARRSEASFRQLADAMPHLVWTARSDGTVDYYNRRSAEFAGLERRPDGSWRWTPVLHPDDRAGTEAAWRRAVAGGQEYQIEHRLQLADGSFRWYLSRGVPVRDEHGRVERWYGTATDIHDQKRAQQALEEADRRKSEFLGVLSHELRNPLAPIRNSAFVASRAAPGSDQARRALATIDRQVAQLTRLVDDLLDVTRIARGKVRLKRERLDLRALAHQVFEDHESLFARNGLELGLDPGEEVVLVHADPARLAQVMGNLLQNAAKFTPRGGRTVLSVRAVDQRLAEIAVTDDGPGIPPDVRERLFEPFVQAESSLDRSAGGLGLGLALVKGLVELHGGTVRAQSAGAGTRFVVTIPRERRRSARPAASEPAPAPAAPRRVLIVEDGVDAAESLREALELEGHQVEVAHTGPEGVGKARALRPDAVICDIGLPGMSGFDVARAIRADPALASVTLIALSGYTLSEDVVRASAAGFDVHLAKPPDLAALGRSIARAREAPAGPPGP